MNRYSYVLNNPILYIDPSGHAHWYTFYTDAVSNAHAEVNNQLAQLDEASGYNPFMVGFNNLIVKTVYDVGFGIAGSGVGLIPAGEQIGEWLADPIDPNKVPMFGPASERLGNSWGRVIGGDHSVEAVAEAVAATAETVGIIAGGLLGARKLGVPGTKGNPINSSKTNTKGKNPYGEYKDVDESVFSKRTPEEKLLAKEAETIPPEVANDLRAKGFKPIDEVAGGTPYHPSDVSGWVYPYEDGSLTFPGPE